MRFRRYLPIIIIIFLTTLLSTGSMYAFSRQQASVAAKRDYTQKIEFAKIDALVTQQKSQAALDKSTAAQTPYTPVDTSTTSPGVSGNQSEKLSAGPLGPSKQHEPASRIETIVRCDSSIKSADTPKQNLFPSNKDLPSVVQDCSK
jgi:hypothetical protein